MPSKKKKKAGEDGGAEGTEDVAPDVAAADAGAAAAEGGKDKKKPGRKGSKDSTPIWPPDFVVSGLTPDMARNDIVGLFAPVPCQAFWNKRCEPWTAAVYLLTHEPSVRQQVHACRSVHEMHGIYIDPFKETTPEDKDWLADAYGPGAEAAHSMSESPVWGPSPAPTNGISPSSSPALNAAVPEFVPSGFNVSAAAKAAGRLALRARTARQAAAEKSAAPPLPNMDCEVTSPSTKKDEQVKALTHQIGFYFGDDNYLRDRYLQSLADTNGWVATSAICSFGRMKTLRATEENIAEVVKEMGAGCPVELSPDSRFIRRKQEPAAANLDLAAHAAVPEFVPSATILPVSKVAAATSNSAAGSPSKGGLPGATQGAPAAAPVAPGAPVPHKTDGRERTFIMIKPDGVQRSQTGSIIAKFEQRGFKLAAMAMRTPGKAMLEAHYADLKGKKFFPGLIDYMNSGPVLTMVWEGDSVVLTGRKLLGATKPSESNCATIRGNGCIDVGRNVCHGSDSVESAEAEIGMWFPAITTRSSKKEIDAWAGGRGAGVVKYTGHTEAWVYEDAGVEALKAVSIGAAGKAMSGLPAHTSKAAAAPPLPAHAPRPAAGIPAKAKAATPVAPAAAASAPTTNAAKVEKGADAGPEAEGGSSTMLIAGAVLAVAAAGALFVMRGKK